MSRLCPHCRAPIGWLRNRIHRRLSKRPDAKWFRYWAARYFCPKCAVELRIVVRPVGHFVNLTILALSAYALYLMFHSMVLVRHGILFQIRLWLMALPLFACNAKWGFSYSVAPAEPNVSGEQESMDIADGTQLRPLLRIASAVLVVLEAVGVFHIFSYPNQP